MAKQHAYGFTLIELVVVMVIIGVLAAYVGLNWIGNDSSVHAQAEQIARDIRHAQSIAMHQNKRLTFEALGNSYRVTASGSVIRDPATQGNFLIALKDSVTVSGGPLTLDGLGRPVSGTSLASSNVTFTVSGSSVSSSITVVPVTGFVAVSP